MTRVFFSAVLLVALVAVPARGALVAAPAAAISVTVDRTDVAATLGDEFAITSTIRNEGGATTAVHIAIKPVSLGEGAYVDPEDGSPRRTITLGPLEAGASKTIT